MGLFGNKTKNNKTRKSVSNNADKKNAVKSETKSSMKDLYEGVEKVKVVAGDKTVETVKIKKYDNSYLILVKPLVTEKASMLGLENKYAFAVAMKANKIEVAKAIEAIYGVKPVKVNILKIEGKKVRSRKNSGQRKDWKKAIVTLPAGKSIQVYEGV